MNQRKRKHSTTVYLDAEQVEALRALSARTHVPWSVYVRLGIDRILAEVERCATHGDTASGVEP